MAVLVTRVNVALATATDATSAAFLATVVDDGQLEAGETLSNPSSRALIWAAQYLGAGLPTAVHLHDDAVTLTLGTAPPAGTQASAMCGLPAIAAAGGSDPTLGHAGVPSVGTLNPLVAAGVLVVGVASWVLYFKKLRRRVRARRIT